MALDITSYRYQFDNSVQFLAKGNDRSILKPFCRYKKLEGSTAFVDGIGATTASIDTPINAPAASTIRTRRVHADAVAANSANETAANHAAMETPHHEIRRQRTAFAAKVIERGHWFNEIDGFSEIVELKGMKLKALMRGLHRDEDELILDAMRSATTTRTNNTVATVTNVSFPNAMLLPLEYETFLNQANKDMFALIRRKFSAQDALDQRIVVVVSPLRAQQILINSGGEIHSKDFVSKDGLFERGEIPQIYGCTVIEHSLVADSEFFAWQEDGLCWGDFSGGILTDMEKDPAQRFQLVAYAREFADVQRTDDFRCLRGNWETTSAS